MGGGKGEVAVLQIRDWCVVLETRRKLMSEEKKPYARNYNGRDKRLNRKMFCIDENKCGESFQRWGGICRD
jgi:hypothetical protein